MMFLLTIVGYSQVKPHYYVVDNDTLGVVFTVEQAQKIDNDLDLLKLYEQLSGNYDKSGTQYIVIVDNMNKQIGILKVEIDGYKKVIMDKDVIIADLKTIVENDKLVKEKYEREVKNAHTENDNLKKQLRKSFWQKVGGGAVALAVIAFLVVK